ncbi:radical SAM protein [Propionivibrio sp.]|uniref:radical SAM protein n=1 Tax=Propionivibrio sp. TaxID=2212460 RepID=UPI003BF169C3
MTNELHQPLKLRFLLTGKCTARCAYCHNEGQTKEAAQLRLPVIAMILETLETAGHLPDEIILSGGEPTLNRELGSIARLCKSTGTVVSLDTHAGHPRLLEPALPYLDEMKVHIDSFDPITQRQSMGIEICNVLTSIRLAKQFPALQIVANHPLQRIDDTRDFVEQARILGVDCKVIEMFRFGTSHITPDWKNFGYTQQIKGHWLHEDGQHRIFTKRCDAEHNLDNSLFIGADGIRRAVDGVIIGQAEDFSARMLHCHALSRRTAEIARAA